MDERKRDELEVVLQNEFINARHLKREEKKCKSLRRREPSAGVDDGNPRNLSDVLYYTGKAYRPRGLRAQWEYKHKEHLRTVTEPRARRPSRRAARRGGPSCCAPSSAFERLNAPRNTNQTPHFDSSRVYIRRRWKRSRSEPLLMPSSKRPREERRSPACVYARCERERRESRRADDRFHGRARQLLRDVALKIITIRKFQCGKPFELKRCCDARTIYMKYIMFCHISCDYFA